MKKKLLALVLSISAILAAVFALTACGDPSGTGKSGNVITTDTSVVFTASKDVMKLTDSTSLKDYMDVLKANEELTFNGSNSEFGFYLTSVNGKAASDTSFWAVYTDLTTLDGVQYSTAEYGTVQLNGKTLYSANYGISSLPCIDGYTYALVYTTF